MNFLATKSQLEMEFYEGVDNQNPIGVESVSAVNKKPIGGRLPKLGRYLNAVKGEGM